jgi:hypothetical protein
LSVGAKGDGQTREATAVTGDDKNLCAFTMNYFFLDLGTNIRNIFHFIHEFSPYVTIYGCAKLMLLAGNPATFPNTHPPPLQPESVLKIPEEDKGKQR